MKQEPTYKVKEFLLVTTGVIVGALCCMLAGMVVQYLYQVIS